MRAVVFSEKGRIELVDQPRPECEPDSVLLRTVFSGVTNGTERNVLLGGNYGASFPAKVGYQLVSEVVECGGETTDLKAGDIVYTGTFRGHVGYHLAKQTDLMVKLPVDFDLEAAALLGVASVSYHDAKRAAVREADKVIIFGAGLIGQFAAQVCRHFGAKVTVIDLDERRLRLAKELAAHEVVVAGTDRTDRRLQRGEPYSVAFECSGANVLDKIIGTTWGTGLIGHRGRVLMIGGRDRVSYNSNAAQGHEVSVLHAGHFEQSDLEEVTKLVQAGTVRIRPLIKDIVPIGEAVRIYEILRDNPNQLLGTIFRWH